ncbi:pigment-dispersing hormone type 1-like [Penaeus japonicus]|uniref:pigment-dispersing hormone type 1-like n=1 Tax=Penaeus japonicus TaxID=27405 RepID=UPI001C7124EF|nr:pigment-dispersing hormone type 1-like [Penaeus japonicus]
MRSIAVVVLLVVMALSLQGTVADSSLTFMSVVSELAAQILRVAQGPSAFVAGPHKRNSELINSLLGIPKVMTDAGRR